MSNVVATPNSQRRMEITLTATAALVPLISFFAPLALAPGIAIAALLVASLAPRLVFGSIPAPTAIIAGCLVLVAAVSTAWAPMPLQALTKAGQIASIFAAGVALLAASAALSDRRAVRLAFVAGMIAVIALLWVERLAGTPIEFLLALRPPDPSLLLKHYDRTVVIVALLLWPTVFTVAKLWGRRAATAMAVAGLGIIALMESRTAMIAAGLGGLCVLCTYLAPHLSVRVMLVILGVSVVLPFALPPLVLERGNASEVIRQASEHNVLSAVHRFRIWEFTAERIAERPVLGWGIDSSRRLPGGGDETDASGSKLPLHPHNAVLQLQVELGIAGLAIGVLLLYGIIRAIDRENRSLIMKAACLASFAAALLVASLSYGLWQSWWLAVLWLTAAMCNLVLAEGGPTPQP